MIRFTDLRIKPASAADKASGLVAYLAMTLPGGLRVDGLTLRRTAKGVLSVSYPERRSASGDRHPILCPATPEDRAAFEAAVLAEVRRQRGAR